MIDFNNCMYFITFIISVCINFLANLNANFMKIHKNEQQAVLIVYTCTCCKRLRVHSF